jgi:hypothetical protein
MRQQRHQRSVEDDCYISTRARMSHQVLDTAQLLERLFRDRELHLVALSAEWLDDGRLRLELHHHRRPRQTRPLRQPASSAGLQRQLQSRHLRGDSVWTEFGSQLE